LTSTFLRIKVHADEAPTTAFQVELSLGLATIVNPQYPCDEINMDVKAAVALAKQHISDLFAEEGVKNLGLEEVDYDDDRHVWRVTIGFSRPWDEPRNSLATLAGQNTYLRRAYKDVRIDDGSGNVLSVRGLEEKV
jgi:hypothetical protein